MKVHYYKNENLFIVTDDYVPSVGEVIWIDDVSYEVVKIKTKLIALHTEVDVFIMEKEDA